MSHHRDVLDLLARSRPPRLDPEPETAESAARAVSNIVAGQGPSARPHRRRRSARRLVLVSSIGAVAATLAVTAGVIHGGEAPAYAVTADADGTITVTVNRVDDPNAANRILNDVDRRVLIMRPTDPADCPMADRGTRLASSPAKVLGLAEIQKNSDNQAQIDPNRMPDDAVVILIPSQPDANPPVIFKAWYVEPGPKCVIEP